MGVHPYHYRCLGLYACLASACRVCAKLGAGRVALRRAAMYTLLQAGAIEAVLAVGAPPPLHTSPNENILLLYCCLPLNLSCSTAKLQV